MIVSHRHRYVFVHIPKTGGTSLTLALEARVGRDDIILSDTPKGRNRRRRVRGAGSRGRLWKHSTLADIEGLVDPAIFDDYLLFTLIRNPWDRAISYYRWLRVQHFDHPSVALARRTDFAGFLRDPRTQAQLAVPSAHYLTDGTGRERPALYLRLDRLQTDLPALESHLGFPLHPLPHENPSPRDGDRPVHDAETAAVVARAAAADIARFGWRFDAG